MLETSEQFGDLYGVQCGAFEQIVRDNPHVEGGGMRYVLANAANKGFPFAAAGPSDTFDGPDRLRQ